MKLEPYSVYTALRLIPQGKVVTYGDLASYLGHPRASRAVGSILHRNPAPDVYPCYKVVNAQGDTTESFAFGGRRFQIQSLDRDGISVENGRVDLSVYRYDLFTPVNVNGFSIRKAEPDDFDEIERVFSVARQFMRETGNPTQWGDSRPSPEKTKLDILSKNAYVLSKNEKITATFAFIIGNDPTYAVIRDGAWLNDLPYGTVHRIASDQTYKGVFETVMTYLKTLYIEIRIDTHENNKPMLNLLASNGFIPCGTITVDDGTERKAFQKVKSI